MMKNSILFLLLVLSSCKGIQWAENAQYTIHRKFPEIEERNCADRFPIIKDSTSVTDTLTSWAKNIDYSALIDSLYTVAFNEIEPLQPNDTCASKLQPYINKIAGLQHQVKSLKDQYKPCDTAWMIINHRTVIREESTAKIAVYQRQADAAQSKLSGWKVTAIVLASILILSIFLHLMAMKRHYSKS